MSPNESPPEPGETPLEVDRFAWPVAELDPVERMRALTAALPHVVVRETILEADFDRVWDFVADLERSTPRYEAGVSGVRLLERQDERLRLETSTPLGLRVAFDVVLRPGWCLMRSRFAEIGMAARSEGPARTRFIHFEGSRWLGRLGRPLFDWNIRHDFRRLAALLE